MSLSTLSTGTMSLPQLAKPYFDLIRFNRPAGTILVIWPILDSLTLAARANGVKFNWYTYATFLVLGTTWSFMARSMGCTINDILDRDVDAQVARTKARPIPSGRISVPAAYAFLCLQVVFYFATFAFMPTFVIQLAFLWCCIIFAYPWMKRITHWPQAWLALTNNFGAVIAWSSLGLEVNSHTKWLLLLGLSAWTLYWDTVYACQDRKDDAKLNVGSTALKTAQYVSVLLQLSASVIVASFAAIGILDSHGPLYFLLSVAYPSFELGRQLMSINPEVPATCSTILNRTAVVGGVVWLGILGDYIQQAQVA